MRSGLGRLATTSSLSRSTNPILRTHARGDNNFEIGSSRTKLSSNAAMLGWSVAVAGWVGVPVEELLASAAIVGELQRENGALVEAARFSAGRAGEAPPGGWDPFIVSPFSTRTEYRLVQSDLSVVLEANPAGSASGFSPRIPLHPSRYPVLHEPSRD